MTMLDAIGPYEVLRNLPKAKVKFVAKQKGEITADSTFVHLNAKYSIDEIEKADILLIPGSTVAFMREMKDEKVLKWIQEIDKTTTWTTSVCSGSVILAAAGVLKGLKATSHWMTLKLLKDFEVIPVSERFIRQEKYITAAGVSAGIDMAMYLSNIIAGEKETKAAQLMIEYDPAPIFDSGNANTAEKEIVELAKKKLQGQALKEMSFWDLLKNGKRLIKLKK